MNISLPNFLRKRILFLTPKEHKSLVINYMRFFEMGLKMAVNEKLLPDTRIKKIRLLQKSIYRPCPLKNNLLKYLQNSFVEQNLSLSLLSDLCQFFIIRASYDDFKTWKQMVDCFQSEVSPIVRLLMVLNNLSPSVYLPFTSMGVSTLLMCNYVNENHSKPQDLEYLNLDDYKKFYMENIKGLFKSAQILPQVVYDPWVRLKICIVIAENKVLFKKINKNKKSFFSMIDYVKAMIYGTFKWVFIRTKSLNTKGI